jgi:hypothetical protein
MLWLGAVLIGTYVGMSLRLPYKVLAPMLALVAVVAAIRVLRLARAQDYAVVVWVAGIASLLGALVFGGIATAQIVFWDAARQYEQCTAQALTTSAEAQCETDYSKSLWTSAR